MNGLFIATAKHAQTCSYLLGRNSSSMPGGKDMPGAFLNTGIQLNSIRVEDKIQRPGPLQEYTS